MMLAWSSGVSYHDGRPKPGILTHKFMDDTTITEVMEKTSGESNPVFCG